MQKPSPQKQKKEHLLYEYGCEEKHPCLVFTFTDVLSLSQTTTTGWSTPTMTTTPSTTPADMWTTTARVWTATPSSSPATQRAWGPRTKASSRRRRRNSACRANTGALPTPVSSKQSPLDYARVSFSLRFPKMTGRDKGESQWFTLAQTRDYSRYTFWLVPAQDPCLFTLDLAFFPRLSIAGFCSSTWSVYTQKRSTPRPPGSGSVHPSAHELFPAKTSLLHHISLPKQKFRGSQNTGMWMGGTTTTKNKQPKHTHTKSRSGDLCGKLAVFPLWVLLSGNHVLWGF